MRKHIKQNICLKTLNCLDKGFTSLNDSENTQIESYLKYKDIQLKNSVSVTSLTYVKSPIVT